MRNLPQWLKITIRVILLPTAFLLHLVPHIVALITNLKNWVLYGGEFMVSKQKQDFATMDKIYEELKKINLK